MILEILSLTLTFGILGVILIYTGQFILIYTPTKGSIPGEFRIENDQITMLNQTFKIKDVENLAFRLVTYEGGPSFDRFKKAEGNENEVSFNLNGKPLKLGFYIPSSKKYIDLIRFLEENDIPFSANRGFPWT